MPTVLIDTMYFDDRFSKAIGLVFQQRPHAFFIGGITLVLAIQLLSLGFLSLQSKRYFDELFHINTSILKGSNLRDRQVIQGSLNIKNTLTSEDKAEVINNSL